MTRRPDVRALRQIVEIRRVQSAAAEMRVADAARVVAELTGRREECVAAIQGNLLNWTEAMSGASVNLSLARAYAARDTAMQAGVTQLDRDIENAQDQRADLIAEWGRSRARLDGAEVLSRSALRTIRRRRDEMLLADAEDRRFSGSMLR